MSLEFDNLPPLNRCGVALIAMISLVERLAGDALSPLAPPRTFPDWQAVLTHVRQDTAAYRFKSDGRDRWPSDFLDPDDGRRIGLTGRNRATSMIRLEQAVISALKPYLADSGPIKSLLQASPISAAATVAFVQTCADAFTELTVPGNFSSLLTGVDPVNFADSIIARTVDLLFSGMTFPHHPDFKSLALFDDLLVRSEFLGCRSTITSMSSEGSLARGSFHLYCVLREARGWTADEPAEVNMIARDLLWIRSAQDRFIYDSDAYQRSDPFIGIFVSSVDRACFYVEKLDVFGSEIIITAREAGNDPLSQRITIIFPTSAHSHKLQIRHGVLSGSAGVGRDLAAWKCAFIMPDWAFTDQMSTIMAQITPRNVSKLYPLCANVSAAGIFFSETMRATASRTAFAQRRRESFRKSLVFGSARSIDSQHSFGKSITDKLKTGIRKTIDDTIASNPMILTDEPEEATKILMTYLDDFVRDNWFMIEPAQIINLKLPKPTQHVEEIPPPLLRLIQGLLDRDNILERP